MWDTKWAYHEVWFSPSGFQKDDAKPMGFVRLEKNKDFTQDRKFVKELNAKLGKRLYELSSISTSYLDQWVKDWNKQIEFPEFKQ